MVNTKNQKSTKYHTLVNRPSIKLLLSLSFFVIACGNDDDPSGNNGIPTITSVTPTEGEVGETIIVKGSNFAIYPQDNYFFFNGVPAEIYVGIRDELLVRVPLEGSTGPVSLLIPGFDTIRGPLFTVERRESATRTSLYYTDGTAINTATFDQTGNVTTETIFFTEETGITFTGLEIDIAEQKIYVVNNALSSPAIYRLNLDGTSFETLYDNTDPAFSPTNTDRQRLVRITLDLEENQLYVTDILGRILRGSMDGDQPLEVLYDDGTGANTLPFGVNLAIGNDYVYWTEAVTTNPRVLRIARDGSTAAEILYDNSDGLLSPKEIVIDESRDRVFVSDDPSLQDGENIDKILVGSLDGTSELVVLLEGDRDIVVNPEFGLALDVINNLLYWGGRPFSGSDDFVVVRADLTQEEPNLDVIANNDDIPGFRYFTLVVTEESANGRLRARVGG